MQVAKTMPQTNIRKTKQRIFWVELLICKPDIQWWALTLSEQQTTEKYYLNAVNIEVIIVLNTLKDFKKLTKI